MREPLDRRLLEVRLPIRPGWDAIEPLRGSVQACVRAVFPDAALADRIALAAGELMENALKYGRWHATGDGAFDLKVTGSEGGEVTISVSNPVGLDDPGVARLREELERIASAPSAEEAFLKRVRAVALKKTEGLGLARVAHEAGCTLACEVTGTFLTVRATTRLAPPVRPTPAAPA